MIVTRQKLNLFNLRLNLDIYVLLSEVLVLDIKRENKLQQSCFSQLFSILSITCLNIYLRINSNYTYIEVDLLLKYCADGLFDCKEYR